MKNFHCDHCGNVVFFENHECLGCGHALGFVPVARDMSALEPAETGLWRPLAAGATEGLYRACAHGGPGGACNWLVAVDSGETHCVSCRLNRTIPDLSVAGNVALWHRLEQAKRRLVYTFLQLELPLDDAGGDGTKGLRFDFLGDPPGGPPVMTGHDGGLITVNIAEADDVERERRRVNLREPFRTLLGHFRHEAAHYCWDRLVAGGPRLAEFRERFGDETADYAAALARHYEQGPPADWSSRFISGYASSHPWEDWAETCAHCFHMVDTVETAAGFGMSLHPRHPSAPAMTVETDRVKLEPGSFDALSGAWAPLTVALNALNRSMGLQDLYPFVLSKAVVEKLRFVHAVLTDKTSRI